MAKIKITLTKEHIKLINSFKFNSFNDQQFGFDTINPYGGDYLFEDLALILGYWDKHTKGTENDFDGRKYGLDVENKMLELHTYIMDNIDYIISIIWQNLEQGIKPGIYTTNSNKNEWIYYEIIN